MWGQRDNSNRIKTFRIFYARGACISYSVACIPSTSDFSNYLTASAVMYIKLLKLTIVCHRYGQATSVIENEVLYLAPARRILSGWNDANNSVSNKSTITTTTVSKSRCPVTKFRRDATVRCENGDEIMIMTFIFIITSADAVITPANSLAVHVKIIDRFEFSSSVSLSTALAADMRTKYFQFFR